MLFFTYTDLHMRVPILKFDYIMAHWIIKLQSRYISKTISKAHSDKSIFFSRALIILECMSITP
jgi:hypothetical protein